MHAFVIFCKGSVWFVSTHAPVKDSRSVASLTLLW